MTQLRKIQMIKKKDVLYKALSLYKIYYS
jgi:hypothetical protein